VLALGDPVTHKEGFGGEVLSLDGPPQRGGPVRQISALAFAMFEDLLHERAIVSSR